MSDDPGSLGGAGLSAAAPPPPDRCAVQAGLRGDPMLGTAFPAPRLLLVEQPGPWGRAGLAQSRFDRTTAHRLIARLDPQHVRVVAIRRPGRVAAPDRRRWVVVDSRPGREALIWGRFRADHELLNLDIDEVLARPRSAGAVGAEGAVEETIIGDDDPMFLVCAHGTHDVCCALMGRPVAAALDDARPGRVWECSHVGGDRFAANVLVVPTGVLYGRVGAHAAAALADAADRGEILDQYLRGRIGFAPEVQTAMAFLHRNAPGLQVSDVRPESVDRVDPDTVAVRLSCAGHIVDVQVRSASADSQWLTCQAAQPSSATVYQPLSMTRRDPAGAPVGRAGEPPPG